MNRTETERDDADVDAVLRQTRADFVGGFGAACASMARLIDDLGREMSEVTRHDLAQLLHRMGGLARTIGFPTVSARARELEDLIRDTPYEQFDASHAHQRLDAIRLAFDEDGAA